jgi:alpha-1,6-mannosyltransferase
LKVVDLTEFYSERGGGVRSHLTLKAEHLARRGIEHRVIAPGPRDQTTTLFRAPHPSGSLAIDARAIRVRGPRLPYDPTYHLLWRVGAVRSKIIAERPDILEINSPYAAALAGLSLKKPRFSARTLFWHADFIDTYVRTIFLRRFDCGVASLLVLPLWALVRRIAGACAATIVTSRGQADKLAARGVPRIVRVPLGVDTAIFSPSRRDQALRLRLLGKGGERASLLVGVGRFAFEKRWDVVIEACAALRQKRELLLVLFGDGPERQRLQHLAEKRGCADAVRFMGFTRDREELAAALASADALVHGCAHETFGLGVAEAVSAGLPIVVPDAGGAREIAAEYAPGASAETYAAGSSLACAAAIEKLLDRPLAIVKTAAGEAAKRAPTVESHFNRLLELYGELLSRGEAWS